MRLPLLPAFILIIVNLLIDYYIWRRLRSSSLKPIWGKIQFWSAIAINAALIIFICIPRRNGSDTQLLTIMWALFTYLTIYCGKLAFLLFDAIGWLPRLWHRPRWRWMSPIAIGLGVLTFGAMWWGAFVTRFSPEVEEVTVEIDNLPSSFDGYRIVQLSDWHVGTYGNDTTFVDKVVDEVNALHPDLIVFTGDIVNRHTSEITPFLQPLSRLKAPDGVVAILGNHDYGDYHDWKSQEDKNDDHAALIRSFQTIGWNLLLNQHTYIYRGGDSIAVIGVENIGDPPFAVYGNTSKAYSDLGDPTTKILLSHNPAHWVDSIANNANTNVALTLAGHTHAMQIEVGPLSPAKWRYPTWGGLYNDDRGQQLYVNIGLGEVALPMRVGANPEITLFTLRRK